MKGLKVGKINYLNLFPIFRFLEKDGVAANCEFLEGVPSRLNKMLREGKIDISPSSSIEYLRHREMYEIIGGHSISSFGPIGSILLFSDRPIDNLNGERILTSSQSETSVVLLDIILRRFYSQTVTLMPYDIMIPDDLISEHPCLLIGDDALIARKLVTDSTTKGQSSKFKIQNIYDLGEIWFKKTGLPFVFALWIVRKDSLKKKKDLISDFKDSLDRAKEKALKSFEQLASENYLHEVLSKEEIVYYWNHISYELYDEHLKGLELFGSMADLSLSS